MDRVDTKHQLRAVGAILVGKPGGIAIVPVRTQFRPDHQVAGSRPIRAD